MKKGPPSKASTTYPQTKQEIAHHVEALTRRFATAINNRNFDLTSPAWDNIASKFQCEIEYPYVATKLPLPNLLAMIKNISDEFPDYHFGIKELHTEVFYKAGYAEVFVKNEFSGAPSGVVKQGVGLLVYRLVKGEWVLDEHRAAAGLDAMGAFGS